MGFHSEPVCTQLLLKVQNRYQCPDEKTLGRQLLQRYPEIIPKDGQDERGPAITALILSVYHATNPSAEQKYYEWQPRGCF